MLGYGIFGGLGGAFLMAPAFASIGQYFHHNRGLATALANTGGPLGGIVLALMLQKLFDTVGFAWATRAVGFIYIGLSLLAVCFLRTRLSPALAGPSAIIPDFSVFRKRSVLTCAIGMFVMEWGLFVPEVYLVSYATAQGQSEALGSALVAFMNTGSIFGQCVPGLIADRWGRFNVIIMTISLCSITILAIWTQAAGSTALMIVFALSFGFASGSNLSLIPVCVSQLCRVEEYGRHLSACYLVASFG
jgi:MFS family permease